MLIIQDKLISDEVVQLQFLCDLSACKGACCWEGDFGAPLEESEKAVLEQIYPKVRPYLSMEGRERIETEGKYTYFGEPGFEGTQLMPDGACAYMVFDDSGIAQCGIEKAYNDGAIDFKKPLSCHLYPLRVKADKSLAFEAVNYDRWEICAPACKKGKAARLPVYQFVKEGLVRKYGNEFYEELDAAARHLIEEEREEGS